MQGWEQDDGTHYDVQPGNLRKSIIDLSKNLVSYKRAVGAIGPLYKRNTMNRGINSSEGTNGFYAHMVYGEPVGKGRPRFAKRGNFVSTYTPQKTKTYEDEIRMMAKAAMGSSEPLDTPMTVAIYIRVGIPTSFSKQKRKDALEGILKPTKKPDADNILKCFLDAMNGIVYLDDKQVVNIHLTKVYAEIPAVEVMVKEDLG